MLLVAIESVVVPLVVGEGKFAAHCCGMEAILFISVSGECKLMGACSVAGFC